MSLNEAEIAAVVSLLAPRLEGARIIRTDQLDRWTLGFDARNGPHRLWLVVSADPRACRIHLSSVRPRSGLGFSPLLQVLRDHFTGARIVGLEQAPGDRIVTLSVQSRDQLLAANRYRLVLELTGLHANMIFVDASDRILGLVRPVRTARRELHVGGCYTLPEPPPPRPCANRFAAQAAAGDVAVLSRAIEAWYERDKRREEQARETEAVHALLRGLRQAVECQEADIEQTLSDADAADDLRRKGELLMAILPSLERGRTSVSTPDLFDPAQTPVEIPLDPLLSPKENAERYFKRYKKLKAARVRLADRLAEARGRLAKVDTLVGEVNASETPVDRAWVERRLKALGLRPPVSARAEKPRPPGPKPPRRFIAASGHEILVARNQKQNEELTFRIARGNDIWVHLADWPGPHAVVRRTTRGEEVSQSALRDAAHLVVHFSRIRGATLADIVYTDRKYVQKARGGKTGAVNYANVKRLAVKIDPARTRALLDTLEDDET